MCCTCLEASLCVFVHYCSCQQDTSSVLGLVSVSMDLYRVMCTRIFHWWAAGTRTQNQVYYAVQYVIFPAVPSSRGQVPPGTSPSLTVWKVVCEMKGLIRWLYIYICILYILDDYICILYVYIYDSICDHICDYMCVWLYIQLYIWLYITTYMTIYNYICDYMTIYITVYTTIYDYICMYVYWVIWKDLEGVWMCCKESLNSWDRHAYVALNTTEYSGIEI